eukprot:scaffold27711_cov21-Tisochrysis_lutea.AAC.3
MCAHTHAHTLVPLPEKLLTCVCPTYRCHKPYLLLPHMLQPKRVAASTLPQIGQPAGRLFHLRRARVHAHKHANVEIDGHTQDRLDVAPVPASTCGGTQGEPHKCKTTTTFQ